MMEEQQRQLLLNPVIQSPVASTERPNPWGQKSKSGSVQPRYKLPPPPHPIQDILSSPAASQPSKPRSLEEIMAEESRLSKKSPLQLPPGSAPTMKSPPWSTPAARVAVAPVSTTESAASASAAASPGHSLGDFIERQPPMISSPRPTGWASPNPKASSVPVKAPSSPAVSFREIQEQEQDFKAKQDLTYGENGKWFIGRRERAGSFKEIQSETAKQTEERLFVEEQIRIEKQIYEELAAQQQANEKVAAQKRPGNSNKKRSKSKNKKSTENAGQTEHAARSEGVKPKTRSRRHTASKNGSQLSGDKDSEHRETPQGQLKSPPSSDV